MSKNFSHCELASEWLLFMADGIPYCISHLNNFFAQDLTYITRICIKIKISLIPEKIRLAMSTHCSGIFSVYFSSSKLSWSFHSTSLHLDTKFKTPSYLAVWPDLAKFRHFGKKFPKPNRNRTKLGYLFVDISFIIWKKSLHITMKFSQNGFFWWWGNFLKIFP
jgi:hypothetical protein